MPKLVKSSDAVQRRYHLVTTQVLENWAKRGDMNAQVVLLARERVRGMVVAKNGASAQHIVYLSPTVSLLFKQGITAPSWVTMAIIVSDNLSVKDFIGRNKVIWMAIRQWRQFLSDWQGPWVHGGEGNFLLRIALAMEQQKTDSLKNSDVTIARRLNQMIAKDLSEYVEDCKLYENNYQSFTTALDAFLWEAEESRKGAYFFRRGKRAAQWLMVTMGLSPDEAEQWCEEAIDKLNEGEKVIWEKKGPMTNRARPGDLVHSKIRQFKKEHRAWLESNKPLSLKPVQS